MPKNKTLKLIVFLIILCICIFIAVQCFPIITAFMKPENQKNFQQWIDGFGVWGWVVLLIIQVGQIIIAVIPGEPVEIAAGVIYGALDGLLICLLGILIGTALVFFTVRKWGEPLLTAFFSEKQISTFAFLHDTKKLKMVTFMLFLIPGTPKDMLIYFAGLTKIDPVSFITIATLARIPSVVSSNVIGATFGQGQFTLTAVVFVITALIGLAGIYINKHYIDSIKKEALREKIHLMRGKKNNPEP